MKTPAEYIKTSAEPKDELDLVWYEIGMLTAMRRLADEHPDTIEGVGWLESFLLHARNLIDFLERPRTKNTKKDDLLCSDFDNQSGGKISPISMGLDSLEQKINKHLSHLTTTRKDERIHWFMGEIERPILQKLTLFLDQLADRYFPTKRNLKKSDFENLIKTSSSHTPDKLFRDSLSSSSALATSAVSSFDSKAEGEK